MHRTKAERQALAQRLLGTASEPGPIDVGWLKARYGIEGSHIKRWREQGIPAARVDDLETAIREVAGHNGRTAARVGDGDARGAAVSYS